MYIFFTKSSGNHSGQCKLNAWVVVFLLAVAASRLPIATAQTPIERPEAGVRILGTPADFPELSQPHSFLEIGPGGRWLAKQVSLNQLIIYDRLENRITDRFEIHSAGPLLRFNTQGDRLAVLAPTPLTTIDPAAQQTDTESDYRPDPSALQSTYQTVLHSMELRNGRWKETWAQPLTLKEIPESLRSDETPLTDHPRFHRFEFSGNGRELLVAGKEYNLLMDLEGREFLDLYPAGQNFDEVIRTQDHQFLLPKQQVILDTRTGRTLDVPMEYSTLLGPNQILQVSRQAGLWAYVEWGNAVTDPTRKVQIRSNRGWLHYPDGHTAPLQTLDSETLYSFGVSSFSPDGKRCVGILYDIAAGENHLVVWKTKDGSLEHHVQYVPIHSLFPRFLDNENVVCFCQSRHYIVPLDEFEKNAAQVFAAFPPLAGTQWIDDHHIATSSGWLVDVNTGDMEQFLPRFQSIDFTVDRSDKSIWFASTFAADHVELNRYVLDTRRTSKATTLRAAHQGVARTLTYLLGGQPDQRRWPLTEMAITADPKRPLVHLLSFDTFRGTRMSTWNVREKRWLESVIFKRQPVVRFGRPIATLAQDGQHAAMLTRDGVSLLSRKHPQAVQWSVDTDADWLAFINEGESLACFRSASTESGKGDLVILNTHTGERQFKESTPHLLVAFASDAPRCLIANRDPRLPVKLYDTRNWSVLWQHTRGIQARDSMTLSPDGKSGSFQLLDGRIEFWDIETMQNN